MYTECNENGNTNTQNAKAVLRGKCMALKAHSINKERSWSKVEVSISGKLKKKKKKKRTSKGKKTRKRKK